MITFQQSFGTAWVGFDYECNFTTFVTLNMFVYYQEDFHVDHFWELNGQPGACQYMTKTNTEEGIITFSSLPVPRNNLGKATACNRDLYETVWCGS